MKTSSIVTCIQSAVRDVNFHSSRFANWLPVTSLIIQPQSMGMAKSEIQAARCRLEAPNPNERKSLGNKSILGLGMNSES